MSAENLIILIIPAAFLLFGGVLAWASWDEARRTRQRR